MKKLFLLTAIAGIFAFSNANAQKDPGMNGPKLGIGAEFGFPVGDFGDAYKFGFGGSLLYQHPVAENLNLTLNAGYLSFKSKELPIIGGTINSGFIPVKVGARYFLAENFYVNGEIGAAFAAENASGTRFAYSPGIGVEFPVADKSAIDLSARYEGWSKNGSLSFIGVRAAFNFGL